jgi:hypothetical protein
VHLEGSEPSTSHYSVLALWGRESRFKSTDSRSAIRVTHIVSKRNLRSSYLRATAEAIGKVPMDLESKAIFKEPGVWVRKRIFLVRVSYGYVLAQAS